jgi:hypothetical protein
MRKLKSKKFDGKLCGRPLHSQRSDAEEKYETGGQQTA